MQTTKEETLLDAGQIVKYPNKQEVLLCLQRSHFCTCKEVSPIGGLFLALLAACNCHDEVNKQNEKKKRILLLPKSKGSVFLKITTQSTPHSESKALKALALGPPAGAWASRCAGAAGGSYQPKTGLNSGAEKCGSFQWVMRWLS